MRFALKNETKQKLGTIDSLSEWKILKYLLPIVPKRGLGIPKRTWKT